MPDRLSDVINVKDWGALGDGSDDAPRIQAAIDYLLLTKGTGGQVYFPPGAYTISSPIQVGSTNADLGIELIGAGKRATEIYPGGYNDPNNYGYLFSKGGRAFDNLARAEGLGGAVNIKMTRDGAVIENCLGAAGLDNCVFNLVNAKGAAIRGCEGTAGAVPNANSSNPFQSSGAVFIALGTGVAIACRITGGCDPAFALSGNGSSVIGGSAETHFTAIRVGWGPLGGLNNWGEVPSAGAVVMGIQTERNFIDVDLYNATGCFVCGNGFTAGAGTPYPQSISNMVWSAGSPNIVTVTTPSPHFIGSQSQHKIQIDFTSNPSYVPGGQTDLQFAMVDVTPLGSPDSSTTFTYPLPTNPNVAFSSPATWTWPCQNAMRFRKVSQSVIQANGTGKKAALGTFDLDYGGAAHHSNNVMINAYASWGYRMPTVTSNLGGWKFIDCSGVANMFGDCPATPYLTMNFADLPASPLEGQEFQINNGQKSGGGTAGWTDIVSGGGSGHYIVRWDGSNWRRIG